MRLLPVLMSALLATCIAGCSSLPHSGPSAGEIADGAASSNSKNAVPRYAIIDLSENAISVLGQHQSAGLRRSFGLKKAAPTGALGVGDTVAVSIYEASAGGLFGTGDVAGGVGTKSVQLPPQQVGRNGKISVPFAGQVRAAGLTPSQVASTITSALSPKAIEPQVLVSLVQNSSSLVTVSGEVGQGGRFALTLNGDRVLDAVAQAGGPKTAAHDIYVRLTRGSNSAIISMTDLLAQPSENVYLRAGDEIFLYRNPKSFTVLGASGHNDNVAFESDTMTLMQALGKAGGLDDNRSNAEGVFVFRYEDSCVYEALEHQGSCDPSGRRRIPLVYRINLRDPNSLLLAQRFNVHDGDLLFISNAPSTELYKFLQLVGTGVGMAGTGANISQMGR